MNGCLPSGKVKRGIIFNLSTGLVRRNIMNLTKHEVRIDNIHEYTKKI